MGKALLMLFLVCLALEGDQPLSQLLEQYQSTAPTATLCDRIGIAYTSSGNLADGEQFFRQALKINPNLVSARKNLGTVLWFLNRRVESEKEFRRVAQSIPNDPVAQLYLGLSAYERKEYIPAAVHLEAAGTLASANPEVFPVLIETYLAAGRTTNALRLLEASARSGASDQKIWIWLGKAYDQDNHPDSAYEALTKAIKLKEDEDEAYLALAEFSVAHANRAFAREVVNRGLKNCPDSSSLTLEAGILWALDGDFERAAKTFSTAHQLAPRSSIPLLALGVAQLQSGREVESAATFQKAALLDPSDYRAEYLYATALSRFNHQDDVGQRRKIESALRKAIALNPKHLKSRVALGQFYLSEKRAQAAVAELQAALNVDPNEASALYQLSLALRRQGKLSDATHLMERFRTSKEKSLQNDSELIQILTTVR